MQNLPRSPWARSGLTLLLVVSFTLLALGLQGVGVVDAGIVLTLLMAVVLSSWAFGLPYSVLASSLAILAHSYFFSVPIYSFEVYNPQHVIAFGFLTAVGLVVGTLSGRLRDQMQRLNLLHRLGQELSGKIDRADVVSTAESQLSRILGGPVVIVDRDAPPTTGTRAFALTGGQGLLGWLTFGPGSDADPFHPERRIWIETLLSPVVLALERVDLFRQREAQTRDLESTLTRNTILHGISHDLRTPLTVISATAETVLEHTDRSDPRRPDLESLMHETRALVRQIETLLELTSLTSGRIELRLDWVPVEDLVYPCIESMASRFPAGRPLCSVPQGSCLVRVDETLVNRALSNLLENAVLYAPGPLEVAVDVGTHQVRFEVSDRGPGVPEAKQAAIFDQFVRGDAVPAHGRRGTGLGLALVRTVAELHGGHSGVSNREGGGATFWFTLSQTETAPSLWGGLA